MSDHETNPPAAPEPCAQCQEYLLGWKRALADYDNLLKDLARAKSQVVQMAKRENIEALLPVINNFEEAVRHVPPDLGPELQSWLSGVLHIKTQLLDTLKGLGAIPFGQVGDQFDPNQHEAVSTQTDPTLPDNQVLSVQQRGWRQGDLVIRPAKVIVNRNDHLEPNA
jgi:molecular chaperone GrpE